MEEAVYHYCSMSTFTKIMRNRSIWLTTLRDSNDAFEGTWAQRKFDDFRGTGKKEYFQKASEVLWAVTQSASKVVGTCFSAERDLLSQWRGYADDGRGFAIGFSVEKIKQLAARLDDEEQVKIAFEPIEYMDRFESEFLAEFKSFVDKQEYYSDGSNSSLRMVGPEMHDWARRVSLVKNAAFKEEKESRLFSLYPSQDAKGYNYRDTGSKLSPYLEVSLEPRLKDIITSVVIGPKNTSDSDDIRDFVQKCGFTKVYDVSKSRASYR